MKLWLYLSLFMASSYGQFTSLYYCEDAGSTDDYACSITPAPIPLAYQAGFNYSFKANTSNTGASTVNFNSLGSKTIVKVAGGAATALADNDIRSGQIVVLQYDGTNMQMQSTLGNTSTSKTFISSTGNGATIGTGATRYAGPLGVVAGEASGQYIIPFNATLRNLYFVLSGTQGANTLVVTVTSCTPTNGACVGSNTAITFTIAGGAAASIQSDTTHTANVSAGDLVDIKMAQTAGSSSGTFQGVSLELDAR